MKLKIYQKLMLISVFFLNNISSIPTNRHCDNNSYNNSYNNTFILRVTESYKGPGECLYFDKDTILCILRTHEILVSIDNKEVYEIWQDGIATTQECQISQGIWHLNAISEFKFPPRENYYPYDLIQPSTIIYVLDTWVDILHPQFEGRASRGQSFETGEHSHGTHVSGIISSKTYGINKNSRIVSVQVLGASGSGSWTTILRGLQWVNTKSEKSIINMSIGGPRSEAVNIAVNSMVKNGWKIVVAAGNKHEDACNSSPASAELAITVGSYNKYAQLSSFSNIGKCVDILAPGESIISTCPNNQLCIMSGTSQSSPEISGLLSLHPEWSSAHRIISRAILGVIKVPEGTTSAAAVAKQRSTCAKIEFNQLVFKN
jgi:hypothetical protein